MLTPSSGLCGQGEVRGWAPGLVSHNPAFGQPAQPQSRAPQAAHATPPAEPQGQQQPLPPQQQQQQQPSQQQQQQQPSSLLQQQQQQQQQPMQSVNELAQGAQVGSPIPTLPRPLQLPAQNASQLQLAQYQALLHHHHHHQHQQLAQQQLRMQALQQEQPQQRQLQQQGRTDGQPAGGSGLSRAGAGGGSGALLPNGVPGVPPDLRQQLAALPPEQQLQVLQGHRVHTQVLMQVGLGAGLARASCCCCCGRIPFHLQRWACAACCLSLNLFVNVEQPYVHLKQPATCIA